MRWLMGQVGAGYCPTSQVLLGDGLYVEHLVSTDHLIQMGLTACREAGLPGACFAIDPSAQPAPWEEVTFPPSKPGAAVRRHRRTWRRLRLRTPARVARPTRPARPPPTRILPQAKRAKHCAGAT